MLLALVFSLVGCELTPEQQKTLSNFTTSESRETQTVEPSQKPTIDSTPVDKVHIVKFLDYACGHCRDAHFTVKNLEAQFGDKVEFELKHYPLSAETYLVAETAECARRQGKFDEYHNLLMEENFRQYSPENLSAVAEQTELDIDQFNTCVANGGGKSDVQADVDEAERMGVSGTPYFLLNDSIPVPGAVPEKGFSRLIQQVLDGERQ